jgi:hypothetical protein
MMKKVMLTVLTLMIFGVVAIAPLVAQDQPASEGGGKTEKAAKSSENAGMWSSKAETVSGTISAVDSGKKIVAVEASGVSYSFKAAGTKIMVGGKKAKLSDLQTGAQASVTFVASRSGNTAKSITVQ